MLNESFQCLIKRNNPKRYFKNCPNCGFKLINASTGKKPLQFVQIEK